MAQRQCEQCGEMVDEAKAFCPACGNAMVHEEKRETQSNYERHDSTMQMGQTMYNQMLSDMGLNIQKPAAPAPEKRVEVVAPLTPAAPRYEPAKEQPQRQSPQSAPTPSPAVAPTEKKTNYILWIAIAAGLFVVGLIVLALIAAFFFWYRTRLG